MLIAIPLLLSAVGLVNAKLGLKSPKYSLLSNDGSVITAEALDLASAPSETLTAGTSDTLKLSFTVIDDESTDDQGVQPHQAFLRFWDEGGVEGIQPVKVSSSGKAKFELNVRRPPPGIPATTRGTILNVDLILGSFTYVSSTVPLFKLRLPPSLPVAPHPEEVLYHPKPAIYHTFKSEQRTPPPTISLVFVVIALSPWVLLFSLLSKLPIHLAPSSATAPFIALLVAFEGLIVWYWVDLRLGQVLTYGAVLAVFTAAAGKRALASI